MIEEAHKLFESAPSKLSEDVAAHFRRQEVESSKSFRRQDEDASKLLDRPPQFSSVHRVQTRRQAILQRSHVKHSFLYLSFTGNKYSTLRNDTIEFRITPISNYRDITSHWP